MLLIRDSFAGGEANLPKVMTLNLMARGAIATPVGEVTPTLRTHVPDGVLEGHVDGKAGHELPSASAPFELKVGVNRLGFTGPYGVDFDVYTVADEAQKALLGNWAVMIDGVSPHCTEKEERQHILRVRGNGAFAALIFSWRKGEAPQGLKVSKESADIVVAWSGANIRISPKSYTYNGVTRHFE